MNEIITKTAALIVIGEAIEKQAAPTWLRSVGEFVGKTPVRMGIGAGLGGGAAALASDPETRLRNVLLGAGAGAGAGYYAPAAGKQIQRLWKKDSLPKRTGDAFKSLVKKLKGKTPLSKLKGFAGAHKTPLIGAGIGGLGGGAAAKLGLEDASAKEIALASLLGAGVGAGMSSGGKALLSKLRK